MKMNTPTVMNLRTYSRKSKRKALRRYICSPAKATQTPWHLLIRKVDPYDVLLGAESREVFSDDSIADVEGAHGALLSFDEELVTSMEKILALCKQSKVMSFVDCLPDLTSCYKIGEGVYGEVFKTLRKGIEAAVLKIVPVDGEFPVNGVNQKTFEDVAGEVFISQHLSKLKENSHFCHCPTFVELLRVFCIRGQYPEELIRAWEEYCKEHTSGNENPEIFENDQFYVVFEYADGGFDLETFELLNASQAKSIFLQLTHALAVAELKFEFEHRDLHWGNILITPTEQPSIRYRFLDRDVEVESCGVKVTIIDYTLSRLSKEGAVYYCDLSDDHELFTGTGDSQFEVYRKMKDHNGNNWENFRPFTNVLWLDYILQKLCFVKEFKELTREQSHILRVMKKLKDNILQNASAVDLYLDLKNWF